MFCVAGERKIRYEKWMGRGGGGGRGRREKRGKYLLDILIDALKVVFELVDFGN